MTKKTYDVPFKRRKELKTNFKKRLAYAKSGKDRIVVRKSNSKFRVQLIKFEKAGDKTIIDVNSIQLNEFGWLGNKNISSAYLTGYLFGKKALKKGFKEGLLDIGFVTPVLKSNPFAVLKGIIDSGFNVPAGEKSFPTEERIKGKTLQEYAKSLDTEEFKKKFSEYEKKNIDVKNLEQVFEQTKQKIDEKFR